MSSEITDRTVALVAGEFKVLVFIAKERGDEAIGKKWIYLGRSTLHRGRRCRKQGFNTKYLWALSLEHWQQSNSSIILRQGLILFGCPPENIDNLVSFSPSLPSSTSRAILYWQ